MPFETIKEILMRRDNLSEEEADDLINEAKDALIDYLECGLTEQAYEVCSDFFGLEPDYIDELIF